MTTLGKFVAVIASLALFLMPASAMPLHCLLMGVAGGIHHQCHMTEASPSGDQVGALPSHYSCCSVSPAESESTTVPLPPPAKGAVAQVATDAFLVDLMALAVDQGLSDSNPQSPGGLRQAVLCVFLI